MPAPASWHRRLSLRSGREGMHDVVIPHKASLAVDSTHTFVAIPVIDSISAGMVFDSTTPRYGEAQPLDPSDVLGRDPGDTSVISAISGVAAVSSIKWVYQRELKGQIRGGPAGLSSPSRLGGRISCRPDRSVLGAVLQANSATSPP